MSCKNLCSGFDQSVRKFPNSPALSLKGETYSYEELSRYVDGVVSVLLHNNISKGDRVGLHLSKSLELYASILAVLKVGAVFVPLEPKYPEARINHIVENAKLNLVIGTSKNTLKVENQVELDLSQSTECSLNPISSSKIDESDLAYILYTSGSTGRPKGVMITHDNAMSFVDWATDFFNYTSNDRVAGHSDLMFDLSIMDTFCAWQSGGHLIPVTDSEKLMCGHFIKKNKITIWFSVPSVLNTMKALGELANGSLNNLKTMLFCGEPLKPSLVRELMIQNSHLRVANLYGPTEATIACSCHELEGPPEEGVTSVSIGWRTGRSRIVVLKSDKTIAEVGDEGFVYILGDQVGPGYWNNIEETQKRFVANPVDQNSAEPCFFTGDVVVVRDDGPHFLGRTDRQVKVNGYRIELNDIEHSLMKLPFVVEAAVLVLEKKGGGEELVGFVEGGDVPVVDEIIASLRESLPDYMVPKKIRCLTKMPRTLNGKLDRKQLLELP